MRKLTCIVCPMGCSMEVDYNNGKINSISGNMCKRGETYAAEELSCPKRMITTTVEVTNGTEKRVPVKTSGTIDKSRINEIIEVIAQVKVEAPLNIGDVIIPNILNTGVDIVATKDIA